MRMVVVFGSQTGTAQDIAEQIWRESKKYGFEGPVVSMDDYEMKNLVEEHLAIFVVATTGNGDEPDNMKKSWKFLLRKNLPKNSLQNLQFACLGLGDSSYTKFNFAAKKLNKRLIQLGATQIQQVGLCDDQHDHGLSAVSLPWITNLWMELSRILGLSIDTTASNSNYIFKWKVSQNNGPDMLFTKQDDLLYPWPYKEVSHNFTLELNKRVTSDDHFQDVRLIRINKPDQVTWQPGDSLQIRPFNSNSTVTDFFDLVKEHNLNFNETTIVYVSQAFSDMTIPLAYLQPLTVEQAVKYHWDLNSLPRQRFFELLALNCEDELEKEKLIEFTTADGLEDLISYVNRPRRSILEVLQDFRKATSKLTLPILFEMMPLIQKRSFSIASIPESGSLDLLVAVVEYKTRLSTPRKGLCSNWLKNLLPPQSILGSIKRGTFELPKNLEVPLIMVGPGTGIAPFRSIIQNRLLALANGVDVGQMVLFFGCRYRKKDFHFSEDFENWQNENLIKVLIAFSRDQDHKVYVQHLIKHHSELMKELIMKQNATVMIAGSSNNMPKAVKEAFVESLDHDESIIEEMIETKRYQEETWS